MIGYMLTKHISRLRRSFVEVNSSTYIVFIAQNVIRTTILTAVNLMSALFILMVTYLCASIMTCDSLYPLLLA